MGRVPLVIGGTNETREMETMRGTTGAALCAAAMLLAACGGSDDSTTSTDAAEGGAPAAAQPLSEAVAELNDAIAAGDCEALMELTFSTTRLSAVEGQPAEPDQPAMKEECSGEAPAPGLLEELEGTTFEDSEEYGPAAVTEGEASEPIGGYDHWAVTWAVDRDGQWRNLGFFPTDPQFEEDLGDGADPQAVGEEMVAAVEEDDCGSADGTFAKFSRYGKAPEDFCEALAGGSIFAPAVRGAEKVEVEELGASRDYGFAGVDTGDTYFLASMATPPIKPGSPPQDEIEVVEVVPLTEFEIVEPEGEKK